jgi:hypothetical protein
MRRKFPLQQKQVTLSRSRRPPGRTVSVLDHVSVPFATFFSLFNAFMYLNSTNDAFLKQVSALSPGFCLRLLFLSSAFLCPNEKLPRFIFLQQICALELKTCLYYIDILFGRITSAQNGSNRPVLRMRALP